MTVRASGLAGKGLHGSVSALFPKVDVRADFVIFTAGAADTKFFGIFHYGLPIGHVLCYTITHEGYGLLSQSLVW